MINANLLPEEIKADIRQAKENTKIVKILYLNILILVVSGVILSGSFFYFQTALNKKNKDLKETEKSVSHYGSLQKDAEKLAERINSIKSINKNINRWTGLISELNKAIPAGVYLNGVKFDSSPKIRNQITGYAFSKNEVATLRDALEKSDLFEYVDIESSQTQADPATGTEKESFTITLSLEKGALNE